MRPCVLPRFAFAALLGACVLAATCRRDDAPPVANSTDPQWVLRNEPRPDAVLVFVHGIFGDTIGTWTNANTTSFFDLIEADSRIASKIDIFAFGYTSNMLRAGSLDIQEAANTLHARLQFHGVFDYPAIVFVTHSMGGLVVLRELLTNRAVLDQVPGLVFFGTPQEGSQITAIAQHVAHNPAIEQMLPADRNGYLRVLNDEWRSLPTRPIVRCAYEKRPTFGVMIVPWESATRFCDGAPVAIDADHLSIVKPDRAGHDAMVVLVNALNEFVLGRTLGAKLETPDFVREGDRAVFTMTDALGRSAARLVNAGARPLRYTLGQISDPSLFVWPDDTPKTLAGNTTERVLFGLGLGATATEYRLQLTSDASTPLDIAVRVPDLAAVRKQQLQLAEDVSRNVITLLSDSGRAAQFKAAKPDDGTVLDAVVIAARDALVSRSPELPESASWLLTADLMDAGNWHGLAVRALRKAEAISRASAQSPGAQRLASIVAARGGDPRVFNTLPAPGSVPIERVQPFVDPSVAPTAAVLAEAMQRVPPLRAQGLSLQGDLQRSRGETEAARQTYSEIAAIRMTPSIALRLQAVTRESKRGTTKPGPSVIPGSPILVP